MQGGHQTKYSGNQKKFPIHIMLLSDLPKLGTFLDNQSFQKKNTKESWSPTERIK